MHPVVISPTIQEFDGDRYYLCGRYFKRKGRCLHAAVWERHYGPVPAGCELHHRDRDRSNNAIDNLECLSRAEHGRIHGPESGERGKASIAKAQSAATEWHGSDEGRRWHSEHYERHIRPVLDARVPAVCQECSGNYFVSAARTKQGKFCSRACKARALRRRRKGTSG